jgi:menaquinone-dependent protoporphyrinogen oxidase
MNALIAYGTRYGSTSQIAEKMGKILKSEDYDVVVANLAEESIASISEYDLIIVGSGIKMGKWTKETLDFLDKFEAVLSQKRVALFVSCGYSREPEKVDEARENFLIKVAEVYPSIKPVSLGFFGGVYHFNKYGFTERLLFRGIKKDLEKQGVDTGKPYDFRDWEEIQKWTKALLN